MFDFISLVDKPQEGDVNHRKFSSLNEKLLLSEVYMLSESLKDCSKSRWQMNIFLFDPVL